MKSWTQRECTHAVRSSNTGVGHDVCAHGLVPCPFLHRTYSREDILCPAAFIGQCLCSVRHPCGTVPNVVVLQQSGGSITATFFAVYRSTALFRKRAWTSRWCALEFSWRHNPSTSPRAMREGDSRVMCRTRVHLHWLAVMIHRTRKSPRRQHVLGRCSKRASTDGGGVLTAPTEPRAGVAKHQRLHVYYFPSDVNVCTCGHQPSAACCSGVVMVSDAGEWDNRHSGHNRAL